MKQQTAVEMLVEKLNQCEPMYSGVQSNEHKKYIDELIQSAREMEKKQHSRTWDAALDAYKKRGHLYVRAWEDFDEYYEEQFKEQ